MSGTLKNATPVSRYATLLPEEIIVELVEPEHSSRPHYTIRYKYSITDENKKVNKPLQVDEKSYAKNVLKPGKVFLSRDLRYEVV